MLVGGDGGLGVGGLAEFEEELPPPPVQLFKIKFEEI